MQVIPSGKSDQYKSGMLNSLNLFESASRPWGSVPHRAPCRALGALRLLHAPGRDALHFTQFTEEVLED